MYSTNKYFSYICVVNLIGLVYSKTIEDPVARHDAKQCGTYLCSSLPTLASQYLQSGCVGHFYDYIKNNTEYHEHLNLVSLKTKQLIENNLQLENNLKLQNLEGVDMMSLWTLTIFSFIISLYVGYRFGKLDKTKLP